MSRWSKTGERIPTTLFELAAYHHSLKARCRRCKNEAVFSGAALWWLFQEKRWSDHLSEVAQHLSCDLCGSKAVSIEVGREPPTITRLPLPDDYSWKKAVARYRS